MRCPKCSFISYDVVETCAKCGKNISATAQELHGTVAGMAAPAFLRLGRAEPEPEFFEAGESEAEVAFDLGGEAEPVLDLGTEQTPAFDLGLDEAAAEPPLDLAGPELEEQAAVFEEPAAAEAPVESFDIADLAPAQEEAAIPVEEPAEELEFAAAAAPSAKPEKAGLGLADLKVEGIDLEAAPGKGKIMPAVKTGTALDDFDIDLGDLIPKKK